MLEPAESAALALAQLLHYHFELVFLLLTLLALVLARRRETLLFTLIVTLLAVSFIKIVVDQPRPCPPEAPLCPPTPGFPSTHAALTLPLAYFTLHRLGGLFFISAAAFVAWSRLALGVHTLIQVAAGVAVGLALALIIEALLREE